MTLNALKDLKLGGLLNKPVVNQANEIDITKIYEDEANARTEFNDDSLNELAESIRENGVVNPISVRQHDTIQDAFIINNGHRRFRASKIAGIKTIPAFLDNNINEFGRFIDNIQREDLSPLDIAKQLKVFEELGYTNRDIASKIGKGETWVSRHMGLLDAPETIKNAIDDGKIKSVEAAKSLANLTEHHPDAVEQLLKENQGEVTQKQVRDFAKDLKDDSKSSDAKPKTKEIAKAKLEKPTSQLPEFQLIPKNDNKVETEEENNSNKVIALFESACLSRMQLNNLRKKLDSDEYDASFDIFRKFVQKAESELAK